jgi:hypothetical protein
VEAGTFVTCVRVRVGCAPRYHFTESEGQVVIRALDAFRRIDTGPFSNVVEVYDGGFQLDLATRDYIRAQQAAGHPTNGAFSIMNPTISDAFRVAHDIRQVIRYRFAWDRNPTGSLPVDFDTPTQWARLPLPTLTSE